MGFADFARSSTSRNGYGDWYDNTARAGTTYTNAEIALPLPGYDGFAAIHPGLHAVHGRISVAKHALREAYFMAKGKSFESAHRSAAGNRSPKWWYIINSDETRTNGWGNR